MFFQQFTPPQVSAFFAGVSACVVLVAAIIALTNLRIIARNSRMQAFEAFEKRWEEVKSTRRKVFAEFSFDPKNVPLMNSDEGQELRYVINNLNVLGSLIENRLVPAHLVFGICYPDFIRAEFILSKYLAYRSEQLGITYGGRIARLARRARKYHDCRHPDQQVRELLPDGTSTRVIYEPNYPKNWHRVWARRTERRIRDIFHLY